MSRVFHLVGFDSKEKIALSKRLQEAGAKVSYMATRTVTHVVFGPKATELEKAKIVSVIPSAAIVSEADVLPKETSQQQPPRESRSPEKPSTVTLSVKEIVPSAIRRGQYGPWVIIGSGFVRDGTKVRLGDRHDVPAECIEFHAPTSIVIRAIPPAVVRAATAEAVGGAVHVSVSTDDGSTWSAHANLSIEVPLVPLVSASEARPSNELRVFISSTFTDMVAEREALFRTALPELRRLCRDRNLVISAVDLRWGVTSSQAQAGTSVLLCLGELRRCDLLIAFVGDRYGWHDTGKGSKEDQLFCRAIATASKTFPFVSQLADRSVTEIELQTVLGGHFECPAWFYVRDSSFVNTVAPFDRHLFESEGPVEMTKLSALKHQIAQSGFPVFVYNTPQDIGATVLRDVSGWISSRFPIAPAASPLERLSLPHRALANYHRLSYLTIDELMYRLDRFVALEKSGKPIVVTSGAGQGKTALLANWTARYSSQFPEDFMFAHFIGASAASTNAHGLVRRAMGELAAFMEWKEPIPASPDELIPEFGVWLERAASAIAGRVVLVLDGLEKLEDTDGALDLLWLPLGFPSKVRVIVSTGEGRPLQAACKRAWLLAPLPLFRPCDAVSFSRKVLGRSSKRLSEAQELRIAEASQVSSPLWLRVVLNELQLHGDFDTLDRRIDELLACTNVSELYRAVLAHLASEYDRSGNGCVRLFFSSLWASRRGLLQQELEEIFAQHGLREDVHTLMAATEDLIFSSGGVLAFVNDMLGPAVQEFFLHEQQEQRFAHEALANFFGSRVAAGDTQQGPRDAQELAWQLEQCQLYDRLRELLAGIDVFMQLSATEDSRADLMRWWRELAALKTGGVDIREAFKRMLDAHVMDVTARYGAESIASKPFLQAAFFLEEMAQYQAAEETYRRGIERCTDRASIADAKSSLARLYEREAKFDEAEEILEGLLKEEAPANELDLARALNRLGAIQTKSGKFEKAREHLTKALSIREKILGPSHSRVGQTLKHMIPMWEGLGNLERAKDVGMRALKLTEDSLGPTSFHVSTVLLKLGSLFNSVKDYSRSEEMLKRALEIRKEKYGSEHPLTAEVLHSIGQILVDRESWAEAEKYYLDALKIMKKTQGMSRIEVARIQLRLAEVYTKTKRFDEAESLLLESLATRKAELGPTHSRVGQSLKHLLALNEAQGKYAQAEKYGVEALELTQQAFGKDHIHTSSALFQLAKLHAALGRLDDAERELRRALVIREHGEGGASVEVLFELARLYSELWIPKRISDALQCIEAAIPLARDHLGSSHPLSTKLAEKLAELTSKK